MDERGRLLVQSLGEVRVKLDEKLTFHTFSKSEGTCQYFYIATTQNELIQSLDTAFELKIPTFVFGSGTKILISSKLSGLTIKNRTSSIKVAGVKGKISQQGLGVEEMFIEADSGVSLQKLNDFLQQQGLQEVTGFSSLKGTIGGTLLIDPMLQSSVQSLRVWEDGTVLEIKVDALKRKNQVILSAIFKFKAKR